MLQLSAGKDASEVRGLVRFGRHCRLFEVSVKLGKAQLIRVSLGFDCHIISQGGVNGSPACFTGQVVFVATSQPTGFRSSVSRLLKYPVR